MKLYEFERLPNPRRVSMFLAEKGLDIPRVRVSIPDREHLGEAYARLNPFKQVPALELDDGTVLTESVAICQYIEGLHPEPNLLGRTPVEQATITMWERRMEHHGVAVVGEAFRNTSPLFAGRAVSGTIELDQIPEIGERSKSRLNHFFGQLDGFLEGRDYLAADRLTLADITGFVAIDFARIIKTRPSEDLKNLTRWYRTIAERPSAEA